MFPDLAQTLEQIADHLHVPLDRVTLNPIRHGGLERNNVWRLTAGGRPYLLKAHLISHPLGESAFTPFQVESTVLSTLYQAGCPVPRVHWKSESAQRLLLGWSGDSTLDDLAQEMSIESLKPTLSNVVQGFCQLEDGFDRCAHALTPYVYPGVLRRPMQTALNRGRKTINYLAWLAGGPMPPNQAATIDEIWARISNRLHHAITTLGSLDYNARNVVIDTNTPTFIDFASIGWDWGARRFVQSLNSLGANRPQGNFVCLLDREIAEAYAARQKDGSQKETAAQVDEHNLLFYLLIIDRLLQVTAQPDEAESQTLLRAWGDAKLRFQRALNLLINSELSDDSDAARLRAFIADFREASGMTDDASSLLLRG